MFKYLLIVLVFWCEVRRFDVYAQTDTSLKLTPNKQNSTEESSKISVTMNGHSNYHVGQQTFYIYDNQFFKRLLDNKDGSSVTSCSTSTHRFYPYKVTWNKARQACIRDGGHLAVINSDSEEKILLRMLQEKNVDAAWLGLHDLYEEGDWVTVMDVAIQDTGYTKWTTKWPNEPDNYGGDQNCAVLMKEEGMDDTKCSIVFPFFCEISAEHC